MINLVHSQSLSTSPAISAIKAINANQAIGAIKEVWTVQKKQLSAEVKQYLANLDSWNEPAGKLGTSLEAFLQKAYNQSGLDAVDTLIDELNNELRLSGERSGLGRGVACESREGQADVLHFYFQEFATERIIGRYSLAVE